MTRSIDELLQVMARLRDPRQGCPWDLKQSFATIAPYTIEEAYEVADAIERGDLQELRDELGDLLLQVVFHAQLAREQGAFDFDDVVAAICDKLVRRHPHVFEQASCADEQAVRVAWEQHKDRERRHRGVDHSLLDGVALALPALVRAEKLQRRAARVGFDWDQVRDVLAKCQEELAELQDSMTAEVEELAEELGDLLFACVNLARHLGIDAEQALRSGNAKFERRFRAVEAMLHESGHRFEERTPAELDELWRAVKRSERHDDG